MLEKISLIENGPLFSPFIQGYWRLASWNMSVQERLTFLNQHVDLGITTVDHADIYGNYECECLFGEALKLAPSQLPFAICMMLLGFGLVFALELASKKFGNV